MMSIKAWKEDLFHCLNPLEPEELPEGEQELAYNRTQGWPETCEHKGRVFYADLQPEMDKDEGMVVYYADTEGESAPVFWSMDDREFRSF